MMNLRLAMPELLVDLARLPELAAVADDSDAVTLGAWVTHAPIEDGWVPDPSRGLVPGAAVTLAYRAIRTRGAIGGSLSLADPAAEWPAVLVALDAEAMISGPNGARTLKCTQFISGIFETRLAPDEIIEGVRILKPSAEARWEYLKLSRKSGEFASAVAVVIADHGRGHRNVVLGVANGAPLVLDGASPLVFQGARGIRDGLAGNTCRCTGYTNIVTAIAEAAKEIAKEAPNAQ
jgi:carbon-monoxide dehydrogenase medium subunit